MSSPPEQQCRRRRGHRQEPGDADQHPGQGGVRGVHETCQKHNRPEEEYGGAEDHSAPADVPDGDVRGEPRVVLEEGAFYFVEPVLFIVRERHDPYSGPEPGWAGLNQCYGPRPSLSGYKNPCEWFIQGSEGSLNPDDHPVGVIRHGAL